MWFSRVLFPLHLLWSPYLLLSTRWTYYRLFCFNQMNDLWKAFADTGLPLVLVLLPYFPQFVDVLETIFLGI